MELLFLTSLKIKSNSQQNSTPSFPVESVPFWGPRKIAYNAYFKINSL